MNVKVEFASVGCNRVVNALDWGKDDLIAYGAHHAVAVYNVFEAKVVGTLLGHKGRVDCVKWLPLSPAGSAKSLASGAADSTIIVWLWCPDQPEEPWIIAAKLTGHSGPVTSLAVQHLSENSLLLASSAADEAVRIWKCSPSNTLDVGRSLSQESWSLVQCIESGVVLQHSLAFTQLPGQPEWLLLAMGSVDNSIRLLLRHTGGQFQHVCRLKGHSDWIRSLSFTPTEEGGLLLASASQDKLVRIWAIQPALQLTGHSSNTENGQVPEKDLARSIARYAPQPTFVAAERTFSVAMDALLVGHEDWVFSAVWQPRMVAGTTPCLLTASMDRTMMLWRPEPSAGLWMSEESVGDAGASSLGYYGGCFSPDGQSIVAHGFTGALHLWRREEDDGRGAWVPQHALGGHYGAVVDMAWGVDGACLQTVSEDQTSRIFTECGGHWCEVARPQIHGHDFACMAVLPGASPPCYAVGSEEKVIRVLEAPQAFEQTLALARGHITTTSTIGRQERALGAFIAALGLSNKAVYAGDQAAAAGAAGGNYTEGPDIAPNPTPSAVAGPPLEEHLAQNTLWPEIVKLYGHANHVFCLAADPCAKYLASACKAQAAQFAAVWLWDVATWTPVGQPLEAHSLTVTQMAFSPSGQHLLTVSRDRTFAVFERCPKWEGGEAPFRLVGRVMKAHARIIWACSWAPNGLCFATGARDSSVRIWTLGAPGQELPSTPVAKLPQMAAPVTSVAFAPRTQSSSSCSNSSRDVLAVGLESGELELWSLTWQPATTAHSHSLVCTGVSKLWAAPLYNRHGAAIRRLAWAVVPREEDGDTRDGSSQLRLASCGEDHLVRVNSMTGLDSSCQPIVV
ncbi:Elongator complex protein 2 [Coccomyxa sp. Obi]|nr:Elongator complex protein 2 [Coccomyxa sp. Obi]